MRIRENLPRARRAREREVRAAFSPLHWMAAGLFVATGAEALASRRLVAQADGGPAGRWSSLRAAPVVVAPLAGAAHVLEAVRPRRATRRAARVADGLAVAAAVAAAAAGVYAAARRSRDPRWFRRGRSTRLSLLDAVAPLAFGATGALGLLLGREEREEAAERRRLERRARLVERLVPRRRARIDRIVVHV